MSRIEEPKTPPHTADALASALKSAQADKNTGAAFVNVDTRILAWLIADTRSLTEAFNNEAS